MRSPILSTPAAAGLQFEDVTFPSEDGVPLGAWFIPRAGSDKLIIVNHPKGFSRSGRPSHLDPWKSMFASSGNDFKVDFIPEYEILHEAGYDILTYDLRRIFVASPAYAEANGLPTTVLELERRPSVGYSNISPRDEWKFRRADGGNVVVRPKPRVRANNGEAQLRAVEAGLGLAVLPTFIACDTGRSSYAGRSRHAARAGRSVAFSANRDVPSIPG